MLRLSYSGVDHVLILHAFGGSLIFMYFAFSHQLSFFTQSERSSTRLELSCYQPIRRKVIFALLS